MSIIGTLVLGSFVGWMISDMISAALEFVVSRIDL